MSDNSSTETIKQPTSQNMPTNNGFKASESKLFSLSLAVFVMASSVSYILVAMAGVNLPRYYPELRQFALEQMSDQIAMGFYGRFLFALVTGLVLTGIFAFMYPVLKKLELAKLAVSTKLMIGSLWFAASIIVVEEWHEWGIVERGLDSSNFLNSELGLFLLGLATFLLGTLLTAAGVTRVKILNSSSSDKNE